MWLKKATAGGVGDYQWTDPDTPVEVPDTFGGQLLATPGNDYTEVLAPAGGDSTSQDAEDSGTTAKPAARRGRTPVRE